MRVVVACLLPGALGSVWELESLEGVVFMPKPRQDKVLATAPQVRLATLPCATFYWNRSFGEEWKDPKMIEDMDSVCQAYSRMFTERTPEWKRVVSGQLVEKMFKRFNQAPNGRSLVSPFKWILEEAIHSGIPLLLSDPDIGAELERMKLINLPVNAETIAELMRDVTAESSSPWTRAAQVWDIRTDVYESGILDLNGLETEIDKWVTTNGLAVEYSAIKGGQLFMPEAFEISPEKIDTSARLVMELATRVPWIYTIERLNAEVPCLVVYIADTKPAGYTHLKETWGIAKLNGEISQAQFDLCREILDTGPKDVVGMIGSVRKWTSRPSLTKAEEAELIKQILIELGKAKSLPENGQRFKSKYSKRS